LPSARRLPYAAGGARLRPGELDGLMLDYLKTHKPSGPLRPTAVAKGLGRFSGAVGNGLARLAPGAPVHQTREHPRRYSLVRAPAEPGDRKQENR
jgi:hypothetical protein